MAPGGGRLWVLGSPEQSLLASQQLQCARRATSAASLHTGQRIVVQLRKHGVICTVLHHFRMINAGRQISMTAQCRVNECNSGESPRSYVQQVKGPKHESHWYTVRRL